MVRSKHRLMLALAAGLVGSAGLPGCGCDPAPLRQPTDVVTSFKVTITKLSQPGGAPLTGGDGASEKTAYPFPFGNVIMHVHAEALNAKGETLTTYQRPVAIRVTPGDLDVGTRWLPTQDGISEGDVKVTHVYGATNIWVMDREPLPVYTDAGPVPTGAPLVEALEDGGTPYTFAAGVSQTLYFKKPLIVDLQRMPGCDPAQGFTAPQPPGGCTSDSQCLDQAHSTQYKCFQGACLGACDNRLSPLEGDFVSLETPLDDNGNPLADMIVTAITQSGFYVSDLKAQKLNDPQNPASASFQALPGLFNSLFVYTYSAPANLYVGDHLISLTGSVSDFSGDTQLSFPAWLKVDADPTPDQLPAPVQIGLKECAVDPASPGKVDRSCGYYNSGMALESLEGAPVVVKNVKPSRTFANCDANGNTTEPLIVNSTTFGGWGCFDDGNGDYPECACEIACLMGIPMNAPDGTHYDFGDKVCTELTTFSTFGQWVAVIPDSTGSYATGTRINVATRDALSTFNPLDLQDDKYANVTFDIAGMLSQVQAARPRWLVYSRDPGDICCHRNGAETCPTGVRDCDAIGQ